MIRFATLLLTVLVASLPLSVVANEMEANREKVLGLGNLTTAPAMIAAEDFETADGIKPIFFDGLDYEGKPTKVFAWLGMPAMKDNPLAKDGKVPAIVLVHGGGGTASRQWVSKWTEQGFAAIAFAHEGQIEKRGEDKKWLKHQWAGPWRRGHYADSDKPLKDQWMYHAVADTVLANSLLRSLPEINQDQIGVMGVSWGGVITSTVMGIDSRFAFAIPTYGCGDMADVANHWGRSLGKNTFYREVWDPVHYLPNAKTPTLWFSWPQDKHFPLDSQATSYRAMAGEYTVCLLPGMKHSGKASWTPPDSYAFAKSVVANGQPWCRQTSGDIKEGSITVTFTSDKPLSDAKLMSTVDDGYPGDRNWVAATATLEKKQTDGNSTQWEATAKLPAGTTGCFINAKSDELTVSSEYFEVK